MKRTIKINLNGMVFHIDEDAYDHLRKYLDQLEIRFSETDGESEIMGDIEARIAEIFFSRLKEDREVVNLDDVQEATAVLGDPEQIGEMASDDESGQTGSRHKSRGRRRAYRDPENRVVGGICTGLGEYFAIDPVIIRILFVVFTLTYGVGILIYLLLWIAIPEARTTAERLEMRGENINVSNIEKTVRQEFDKVKERYHHRKTRTRSPRYEERQVRRERRSGGFFHVLGQIILVFLKIIGSIIGFSFIIAGVAILVAMLGALISGNWWLNNLGWDLGSFAWWDVVNLFMDETVGIIAFIALLILVAVPVLGLIYGGVKLLFRFRANDRAVLASSLAAWLIALVVIVIVGLIEGSNYTTHGSYDSEFTLKIPENKKIILEAGKEPDNIWDESIEVNHHNDLWITSRNGRVELVGHPRLDITKSKDDQASVQITREARGTNLKSARQNAEKILYGQKQTDSVVLIDPVFSLARDEKFRVPEVSIEFYFPIGTIIYLDPSIKNLLYAVDNTENRWSKQLAGETWIMTEDGLSLYEK